MSRFRPLDRNTDFLLQPSVQDWLPPQHLARYVVEVVDQLDLAKLETAYAGKGSEAYHPAMLLTLLIYGYANGVFSSRKLERATYDSLAFRFIACNQHPDHDTLANFRRRFAVEFAEVFVQVLQVARENQFSRFGTVSLDGTKIHANASRHRALSYAHAEKIEAQLKSEVQELLQLAEQADRAGVPDGMSIPEELARREDRLAAIAQAKTKIEARAKERFEREQAEYEAKMKERREKEAASGKKARGEAPKPPEGGPLPTDQISLTDEESRIMPVAGGGFDQCYNAQALVDATTMLVIVPHVTQAPNDKQQVEPVLAKLQALPEGLNAPDVLLADCGYCSENNVEACQAAGIEPLLAMKREHHHPHFSERFREPAEAPADTASAIEKMKHKLATRNGKALYALRKQTVEPVFGMIKSIMGFRQFLTRGLKAVQGEWTLVCLAWNLKRMGVLRLQ